MIAEIIETLEVTKACLRVAEADAEVDQWGVMAPAELPLQAVWILFIRMYPRKGEIIHLLVSSSLMALPTVAGLEGPLARGINRYMGNRCYLRPRRIEPFRLAMEMTCSAFGVRQILYDGFLQADSVRGTVLLHKMKDRQPHAGWVRRFMELE